MCALTMGLLPAVLFGTLFAVCYGSSNFPAGIPRCHTGDVECIKKTSTDLIRLHAKTGYPEAAFPVIEPFFLKRFDITDGRMSSLSLKLSFRDIDVGGLSTARIDRIVGFGADPANSKFEIHGVFQKITLKGKYTANGRILILPIQGDGDTDIALMKPKFSVKFKPAIQQRDGKTFISVDKIKMLIEPERMTLKLTNLFNGDPALGQNLNEFLNENWRDVWNELQPSIHSAVAEIIKGVATPIFNKFAYADLYLDN